MKLDRDTTGRLVRSTYGSVDLTPAQRDVLEILLANWRTSETELVEQVNNLRLDGVSVADIATVFGVHMSTLYRWIKSHES